MSAEKKHISQLVTWHFLSSILFEGLKASHQACLFIAMPTVTYGKIGAIFSLIYLSAYLFGFEGGSALIPFASSIANSPNRHKLLSRYLVIPQILLQAIGATLIHTTLTQSFVSSGHDPLHITLFITISTLEGLRMALRTLSHTIVDSRRIIPFETVITIAYFGFIWMGYLFFGMPLTVKSLLIPYLVTSFTGTLFLLNAAYHYPTRLPRMQHPTLPSLHQNIRLRTSLSILRLPHNLFSANLLIPFFAQINIQLASYMKLATAGAHAIRSIVRSSIGLTANAIFSTYIKSRTQAFNMLWNYLITGIAATLIVCMIMTAPCYIMNLMRTEAIIITAFSIMYMLDYLFILYEHFFIVANTSNVIAFHRIIETAVSAIILWQWRAVPLMVIAGFILVRMISLGMTIYRAHRLWRIRPKMNLHGQTIKYAIVAGVGMAMVSTHIKLNIQRRNPSAARPTTLFLQK